MNLNEIEFEWIDLNLVLNLIWILILNLIWFDLVWFDLNEFDCMIWFDVNWLNRFGLLWFNHLVSINWLELIWFELNDLIELIWLHLNKWFDLIWFDLIWIDLNWFDWDWFNKRNLSEWLDLILLIKINHEFQGMNLILNWIWMNLNWIWIEFEWIDLNELNWNALNLSELIWIWFWI